MMSEILPMRIGTAILLALYSMRLLAYFTNFADRRTGYWPLLVVSSLANITVLVISRYFSIPIVTNALLMFGLVFVEYLLLYRMSSHKAIFASGLFVFYLIVWRGIMVGVFAIALDRRPQEIITTNIYYYPMFASAIILALIFSYLIERWLMPQERMVRLFRNVSQLTLVAGVQVLLIAYLLFINTGRVFMRDPWFSYMYLGTFVLVFVAMAYIYRSALNVSSYIEEEVHSHMLEEQLKRQVRHYEEYKDFTESYRAFRHDFNTMMGTVKTLIRRNESERAIEVLGEVGDNMQGAIKMHPQYSDNVLLDALLQDIANACRGEDIEFSAAVHLPVRPDLLSDLDVVRLASNLLYNAYEACLRVPKDCKRFIRVKGSTTGDWHHVEIENSFTGDLRYEGNDLASLKEASEFHGIGLKIAREIVDNMGGVLIIDPDITSRVFRVRMTIPVAGA